MSRRLASLAAAVFFSLQICAPGEATGLRDKIVETAKSFIGVKYRYGGTGDKGFDCSGFVAGVYGKHGIALPHSSKAQYLDGDKIQIEKAMPGDLVFFAIRENGISHVGIYLGGGSFIHAPSHGKKIMVSDMNSSYWKKRFAGAATYVHDR